MDWLPANPSFIYDPRDRDFRRVTTRNTWGGHGKVEAMAVPASDPTVVYVVGRPQTGGAFACRSDDGAATWTSIADPLQRAFPAADPQCVAVHPQDPQYVAIGTAVDSGVYISTDGGRTWGPKATLPGWVFFLLIDGRRGTPPAAFDVYAGTTAGVYRSADGGRTFAPTPVVAGPICDLVADIPATGTANFFAGVMSQGVYHATDPTSTTASAGGWQLLSTRPDSGAGPGMLPSGAVTVGTPAVAYFDFVQIAVCPNTPGRAYVWHVYPVPAGHLGRSIYTTSSPRTSWTMVAASTVPQPGQNLYCMRFAAAPNSPGDGASDVLFVCGDYLNRSTDGGRTWADNDPTHVDYHAIAFAPPRVAAGTVPVTYVGCDGGVGRSTAVADPAFDFDAEPTYFNQRVALNAPLTPQARNRYLRAFAFTDIAMPAAYPALGFMSCVDTGVHATDGGVVARKQAGLDSGPVAATAGSDGIVYWYGDGSYDTWPGQRVLRGLDTGGYATIGSGVNVNGAAMWPNSNLLVGPDNNCYCGVAVRDVSGTVTGAIAPGMGVSVTPSSMNQIATGSRVLIDQEFVQVRSTTATTFTANVRLAHAAGAPFSVERNIVVRIDQAGSATVLGQDMLDGDRRILRVAIDPTDANKLYAATVNGDDGTWRVFRMTAALSASASTAWSEVTGGQLHAQPVANMAAAADGRVYVLLTAPAADSAVMARAPSVSPLYEISGGSWLQQPCAGYPTTPTGFTFGALERHPTDPSTLYASYGPQVFRVQRDSAGLWTWTGVSNGLPGRTVSVLRAGNYGTATAPRVVLRTGGPATGVFERDFEPSPGGPALYMRDNVRDPGWLRPSPENVANPYRPAERVWHYQSPDVKLDAEQGDADTRTTWHQIEPEFATLPIDATVFGCILDNSRALPGLEPALVHAQVFNRSAVAARQVWVWALATNASAGLPSLARSDSAGNRFPFWSQFTAAGDIVPALPADSPWHEVGPPITIAEITADRPRVASWTWAVPLPPSDRPLHYCIAVFIHCAAAPLNPGTMSVDDAVVASGQVAQKNLNILPVLAGGG